MTGRMGTSAGEGPDGQECSFPAVSVIDRVTGTPRTLYTGTGSRQANNGGPLLSGLAASDPLALDRQRRQPEPGPLLRNVPCPFYLLALSGHFLALERESGEGAVGGG